MGITNTVKNLVSGGSEPAENAHNTKATRGSVDNPDRGREYAENTTAGARRSGTHKLPPGTGPGTSGKPASEAAMEYDRERAREQGTIAGYGTDSAAAHGGGLADTHRDSLRFTGDRAAGIRTVDRGATGQAAPVTGGRGTETTVDRDRFVNRGSERSSISSAILDEIHQHGHSRHNARDVMPSGATQEDTNQLNPVTHERVRQVETEEVQRVKSVDRHVHHIQHHIQPVLASETLAEVIEEFTHPVTNVRETHSNKVEDRSLLDGQVSQHQDTLARLERERTIIDKGVEIQERVHHHVHHVIQPIIEKETIERRRIHTLIPIHEVTHEAPIVHQSQTHSAVPIEHFLERGGILTKAIPTEDIATRVLHTGQCTREVEGVADSLSRELNLGGTMHDPTTTMRTDFPQAQTQPQLYRDAGPAEAQRKGRRTQVETETDAPVTMPMA